MIQIKTAPNSRDMIALMVTRKCNMTCAHCSVASSPSITNEPTDDEVTVIVEDAIRAGVKVIQFTGGEPMLREELILKSMKRASSEGVASCLTSNGFWGEDLNSAGKKLVALRKAGMIQLTISYDPFHEKFLPIESVKNIARAASDQNFTIQINLTRLKEDKNLDAIVEALKNFDEVQLRFYDIQSVGRAKKFPVESLRGNIEGFCNACERVSISDDGRVMACNGPAYFSKPDSPLIVGSLEENSLDELLDRHAANPILQTIRTKGPLYLKNELAKLPEGKNFPFKENYNGLCDLCLHLNSDPNATEALLKQLSTPREQAQRESLRLLIEKERNFGEFNRTNVNRGGITKILLDGSISGILPDTSKIRSYILSRSDLDWQQVLRNVCGNGLARPLLSFFQSEEVKVHAPSFVQSSLERAAVGESLKLVQVETVLRIISDCLQEMGTGAVLLKGGALVVQSLSDGEKIPCKTPGDIDLYLDSDRAEELRDKLLERGFEGLVEEALGHHLPSVTYRHISVEIHVSIMPEFWGLPERELINSTVPVPGWEPFTVLSIEAFLLHTAVHTASEGYTHGLKTFWGQLYAMHHHGVDAINWELLLTWVKKSRSPRAFWIPIQIAYEDFDYPIPAGFMSHAPALTKRHRLLLRYARSRLFHILNHYESGFFLRKFPHDFLLTDSFSNRLKLIGREVSFQSILLRLQYIKKLGLTQYLKDKWQLLVKVIRLGIRRNK